MGEFGKALKLYMGGPPRREVAQEFYTQVIGLGEMARDQYLKECRAGVKTFNQADLDEIDANLNVCRAELAKFK